MKRKGSSIIFINDMHHVLLFLRDNRPDIPYPGMWDVPGGHVEENETPAQCIIREMHEELELELSEFHFFSIYDFSDRSEHVFWKQVNLDLDSIVLHEGQYLKWFTEEEAAGTKLPYGFNKILKDFFYSKPFLSKRNN